MCNLSSNFLFTFMPISSKITKSILPPSKAGKGIRFKIPTFTDKSAVNHINIPTPSLDASPTTFIIPIGPLISSDFTFPLTISLSPPRVSENIFQN